MVKNWYWNEEDDCKIRCPYCFERYDPSYEDTYIGGKHVDCYEEETQWVTCDTCGKRFTVTPYQSGWNYRTETIDGEITEEEYYEQHHK